MATNRTPDSYATTPQPVNTEDGSLSVNSDHLRDDQQRGSDVNDVSWCCFKNFSSSLILIFFSGWSDGAGMNVHPTSNVQRVILRTSIRDHELHTFPRAFVQAH